jgi:hypothetical protein
MSAIAKQMLDRINAIVEAHLLGTGTAGTHCAVASGSVLRARDIENAAKKFCATKPLVGFVCRPDAVVAVRRLAEKEAHPHFGAVPVYEKPDQVEQILAFYDREQMNRHLSPNTQIG